MSQCILHGLTQLSELEAADLKLSKHSINPWAACPKHPIVLIVSMLPEFHPGSNPGLVMWDSVMDKSGAGAGFLRELRFPLPLYIPSASPQSSSLSPEAGTIGQEWPQCQ
jgi:hypothetical protein